MDNRHKRPGVNCPGFPHVRDVPCEHCDEPPIRTLMPPTPGFNKLGPAAQERALARAKNFYPFD